MYRVYYTDPKSQSSHGVDTLELAAALSYCEQLRASGYLYVVMVSDYQHMVGKPGVSGAGTEYVPQMLS
jgi:hypothetical protein